MNQSDENHIDHEVRIRLLEKIADSIDKRFERIDNRFLHLENKIDNKFNLMIGIFIASPFIAVVLHHYGLL